MRFVRLILLLAYMPHTAYPAPAKAGTTPPQLRPSGAEDAVYVTGTRPIFGHIFSGTSRGDRAITVCMPFPKPYEPTLTKTACQIFVLFES